jgi:hypothetical protein
MGRSRTCGDEGETLIQMPTSERCQMRSLCMLLLVTVAASCREENQDSYLSFHDRLNAGAACEELFGIRNAVDPKSPLIERMNQDLRGIGCFSTSSMRTDQKGKGMRRLLRTLRFKSTGFIAK